jgi:hypothetical protein
MVEFGVRRQVTIELHDPTDDKQEAEENLDIFLIELAGGKPLVAALMDAMVRGNKPELDRVSMTLVGEMPGDPR